MIIAIPVTDNTASAKVNTTLGRSPFYLIYNSSTKETTFIRNTAAEAKGGAGIKAAQLLLDQSITDLITPRSGTNALDVLKEAGVNIYESNSSDVLSNITDLENNKLNPITEGHAGFHHA